MKNIKKVKRKAKHIKGGARVNSLLTGIVAILVLGVSIYYGPALYEQFMAPYKPPAIGVFEDVEVDEDLLNVFFFDVGQADSTFIMSGRKNNANRCRSSQRWR